MRFRDASGLGEKKRETTTNIYDDLLYGPRGGGHSYRGGNQNFRDGKKGKGQSLINVNSYKLREQRHALRRYQNMAITGH